MILAIDPGSEQSAYVILDKSTLKPIKACKLPNERVLEVCREINDIGCYGVEPDIAIEMIASYGMSVGQSVFETCVWIGRFEEAFISRNIKATKVYRKQVKMNLCYSMKANDSNITQALVDRFAPNTRNKGKGTKKEPGWFYGFKKDIWQAYAVGVTYHDIYLKPNS